VKKYKSARVKEKAKDNAEAQRTQRFAEEEKPKSTVRSDCATECAEGGKRDGNTEYTEVRTQRSRRTAREETRENCKRDSSLRRLRSE
jgi:hypothetical protein